MVVPSCAPAWEAEQEDYQKFKANQVYIESTYRSTIGRATKKDPFSK